MMNPFVYDIPTKVYFGPGKLEHLGAELAALGKRVLLCYGGGSIKRSDLYDRVVAQIQGAGLELWELPGIDPNPRVTSVRQGAQLCKEYGIDVVPVSYTHLGEKIRQDETTTLTSPLVAGTFRDCLETGKDPLRGGGFGVYNYQPVSYTHLGTLCAPGRH